MNIKIKKLSLLNFKGIRELSIEFDEVTNIHGENGTGKSTIFDAFTWLLFGKDSHDSKDFNIKTLDAKGKAIPMLDHVVEGILDVDGTEITLKRSYQEKWQRRRGAEESELTGHETLFYWNGVPQQAGEFKTKVDALVNEGLFKLLTSTLHFNSMKWQDRRQVLILIAGEISNADVLAKMNKQQVADITLLLNSGKPLADFLKELAMRKKKLSDDLKTIPSRIDEVTRSLPEPVDFEAVKSNISNKQALLLDLENTINDQVSAYKTQGEAVQQVQNQIFAHRKTLQSLEFEAKSEAQKVENERILKISDLKQKLAGVSRQWNDEHQACNLAVQSKSATEAKIKELRELWSEISIAELKLGEGESVCPTCKREFDPDTLAEKSAQLRSSFNENNSKQLSGITAEGRKLSVLLGETNAQIDSLKADIDKLSRKAESLSAQLKEAESIPPSGEPDPDTIPRYADIKKQISILELQILEAPKLDIESLKLQKSAAQAEIYDLQVTLGHLDVITRGKSRIKELLAEEKSLAGQISELEKQEFAMNAYTRSRMDTVESRINGKFNLVRFRMFNTLINGGIEEACECMVQGVPFSDVNSAGKIQAGIDIINTLSKHYGISAPIWIDNRESTNTIPSTTSQVINLIVSTDKSLIIK
jgi:DNA repair exonuclease SbcCD ATPase subunit